MESAKSDTQVAESPVIELPASTSPELRARLEAKLEEYKGRVNPNDPLGADADAVYKIAVLQTLLDNGRVVTYELSRALGRLDPDFDPDLFQNACDVIVDYMTTNGANVVCPSRPFQEIPA